MIIGFDVICLCLILLCAILALYLKDLMGAVIVFGGFDISVSKRLDVFNNFTPENLSDFHHDYEHEQVRYQKIE